MNTKKINEINFLNSGRELLSEFNDCPFCLSSTKNLNEIKLAVENRLKEFEDIEFIERDIRENYRELMNILWTLILDVKNVYDVIISERSELIKFASLDKLSAKENDLYLKLSPLMFDELLSAKIFDLYQTQFPTEKDYQDLYNLINQNLILFEQFYPQITNEIKTFLPERKLLLEKEVVKISNNNETLTIQQKNDSLQKEITDIDQSIKSFDLRNEHLKTELVKANKTVLLFETIKNEIKTFNLRFNVKKDLIISESFIPMKEIVEEIMKDFIDEKENIKLEIKLENVSTKIDDVEYINKIITAKIYDINREKYVTPDVYFNTFRYKLFCLMISLSLALATRKKYKINLPLVMDDLFYASDYLSKHAFSKFIMRVIQLFYRYTPDLPLQFILFTHDDLVFKSAIESLNNSDTLRIKINELCDENKLDLNEKTIIARVFDLKESNNVDDILQKFENNIEFMNILYELPKELYLN